MKKTNGQKGITLVALVITIIILLILATISIQSLTNTGLFRKAKEATKKYSEAEEWYSRAYKNGIIDAAIDIGNMYFNVEAYEHCLYWYEKAAKEGHLKAQNNMGVSYFKLREYKKAEKWLVEASDSNLPIACFNLGVLYTVLRDEESACIYYKKGSTMLEENCKYNLAIINQNNKNEKLKNSKGDFKDGLIDMKYNAYLFFALKLGPTVDVKLGRLANIIQLEADSYYRNGDLEKIEDEIKIIQGGTTISEEDKTVDKGSGSYFKINQAYTTINTTSKVTFNPFISILNISDNSIFTKQYSQDLSY